MAPGPFDTKPIENFIYFMVFIFAIFILLLIVKCVKISIKYLCKYRKSHKNIFLWLSFITGAIGIFLTIYLISTIWIFHNGIQTVETKIVFNPIEEVRVIEDIVIIEQSMGSYVSNKKEGYFKNYEEYFPNRYQMEFKDISKDAMKIKFNSIKLIINNVEEDIISIEALKYDYNFPFLYSYNIDIQRKKSYEFWESREINITYVGEIDNTKFYFPIEFDYKSVEFIIIEYDIEIELANGENKQIKNSTKFIKEINEK
jgi:hypothetical protein